MALCQLCTPQVAAELAGQVGSETGQIISMAHMLEEHVAHAHRFAACLVQFGALDAICEGCAIGGSAKQKGVVLTWCLRAIRNAAASLHCVAAARLLARQVILLWSRLGCRLLAPHLRRLLGAASGGGSFAEQAARTLRGDMRTLGWLLHHSPELRPHLRPLCTELTMKAITSANTADTIAVIIGAAANANALVQDLGGAQLYQMLDLMPAESKLAVQQVFQFCAKFVLMTLLL